MSSFRFSRQWRALATVATNPSPAASLVDAFLFQCGNQHAETRHSPRSMSPRLESSRRAGRSECVSRFCGKEPNVSRPIQRSTGQSAAVERSYKRARCPRARTFSTSFQGREPVQREGQCRPPGHSRVTNREIASSISGDSVSSFDKGVGNFTVRVVASSACPSLWKYRRTRSRSI